MERPKHLSARLAFVFAAGIASTLGCGDSSSTPSGDESETESGGTNSPSGSSIPGNGQTGSSTSPTQPTGGGATEPPPPGPAAGEDFGQGDGKDIVMLGDSYMRYPNRLTQGPGKEGVDLSLQKVSSRPFRTYAFTGGSALPPVAVAIKNGVIPGQFDNAKKEGADIKTVVMTGGGNDLPQGGGACKGAKTEGEINADCKSIVVSINEAIDKFVTDMAKQGVKDLVWVGYGPTDPEKGVEGAIAALRADRKAKCVPNNPALGLRCHYIDDVAANIPTRDGFHPTSEGYDSVAKAVWERMQKEGTRR